MRHDFGCLKYIELGCKRAGLGWIGMLCHTQWGEKDSEGEILTLFTLPIEKIITLKNERA